MVTSLRRGGESSPKSREEHVWMEHTRAPEVFISLHTDDAPLLDYVRDWSHPHGMSYLSWDEPTEKYDAAIRKSTAKSTESLRQRLANANDYFQRKANEVFNDEAALGLLAAMYRDVVVDIAEFDPCENGMALAKLTAANFCEVGAKVIYITKAGQRFIESIEDA